MVEEINYFRYREHFNLSYQEFLNEPMEAINFAFMIWALEKDKAAVDEKRATPL